MGFRISVVLATYNGEQFIGEQLRSISAQRRLPDELIVTDDGSSDNTLEIIRNFAQTAQFPVTVLENKHCGWADNFIVGLSKANGDVVSYCDQDDIWHPNKLSSQLQVLEQEKDVVLVTHSWRYLRRGRTSRPVSGPLGVEGTIKRGAVEQLPAGGTPGMTMMLTSHLAATLVKLWPRENQKRVQKLGFWIIAHDGFSLDVGVALGAVRILPEALVTYRKHENNVFDAVTSGRSPWRAMARRDALSFWKTMQLRYGERAAMYEQVAHGGCAPEVTVALRTRAAVYQSMAEGYRCRVNAHTASSLGARAKAYRALLKGGYRQAGRSGLRARAAAVRDLVGVLNGR